MTVPCKLGLPPGSGTGLQPTYLTYRRPYNKNPAQPQHIPALFLPIGSITFQQSKLLPFGFLHRHPLYICIAPRPLSIELHSKITISILDILASIDGGFVQYHVRLERYLKDVICE